MPLGNVSYRHERIDDDTVRYADIAIASPIEVQSADGEPQGEIAFALDRAEAVWSESLASFIGFDFSAPSMR
ncbi:hypothetical protein, partial [Salmonella enterica]|uniref:hypothetical protein n=1 Tax=Salmonella enterica TaxID=28901 RepID=UPI0032975073